MGAVRPDRARGGPPRGGGAGVIETWKRVLVLAPHTDDGEFGCGGTMARLVEAGSRGALPRVLDRDPVAAPGFAPDTLAREVREATGELGIPESHLVVHDFDVRTFPERRQDILELLVGSGRSCGRTPSSSRLITTCTRITRRSRRRGCARSSGRPCSGTRFPGTTSTSPTARTSRSSSGTSRRRSRRSASTHRSSTAATRIPNTSGTSPGSTGSTSTASMRSVFQVYRIVA